MKQRRIIRNLKKIVIGVCVLSAVMTGFAWLALASPMFNDQRATIASRLLTEALGYPVHVNGHTQILIGPTSKFWIGDASIQSVSLPELSIASLKAASFDVDTRKLFHGDLRADNIMVDGLNFLFLRDPEGRKSWQKDTATSTPIEEREYPDIVKLFQKRSITARDTSLTINLQDSGFLFEFEVASLDVLYSALEKVTEVRGIGTLNGQSTTITGTFPDEAPFSSILHIGRTTLTLEGEENSAGAFGEIDAILNADIKSAGEFLETIGLKRTFEGDARMQASVRRLPGVVELEGESIVNTVGGQKIIVAGTVGNILRRKGFDLDVTFETEHAAKILLPVRSLRDFKLQSISAKLKGDLNEFVVDGMTAETNLFDPRLGQVGPMHIDRFYRTPQGTLSLDGIIFQAGPLAKPFVKANGSIKDLMSFEEAQFKGTFRLPGREFFSQMTRRQLAVLGGVKGDFELSNFEGPLSLIHSQGTSYGTESFKLFTELRIADVGAFSGIEFSLDLNAPHAAAALNEFEIKSGLKGGVEAEVNVSGDRLDLAFSSNNRVGNSPFSLKFLTDVSGDTPTLSGLLESARVELNDLQELFQIVKSISMLAADPYQDRVVRPLVLAPIPKPLVLQDAIKPLVIVAGQDDPAAISLKRVLREFNVDLKTQIGRISGVQGRPSIHGDITLRKGVFKLAPLRLGVIGGRADITTEIDLVNRPERLKLSGTASGLKLQTILELFGLDLAASGVFSGWFDVAGILTPDKSFENTLSGRAALSLDQGRIATAMLDLAGLGVVPWLFSKERAQGYTDLVCVFAPLTLRPGQIHTRNAALETARVRVLVNADASWANNSIALRAVPISKRSATGRSPFPVTMTGMLNSPTISVAKSPDTLLGLSGNQSVAPEFTQPCRVSAQQ